MTPRLGSRDLSGRLTPLRRASDAPDAAAHLITLQAWVDAFLSASNLNLGRSGPVCPFTRGASERDLLWVSTVPGQALELKEVERELHAFTDLFRKLEPTVGSDALLKAILITFPELDDITMIESLQRDLKSEFVAAGLMIGEFYPGCTAPGMWNPDFRPLDCPVPLIAIRQMVSSDFVFLNSRSDWVKSYLRVFAPGIPDRARAHLAASFDAAGPGTV
jgi:hypothetical protein